MELERIFRPLMLMFNEDININNGPTHITDLIMITIKSLIPSEDSVEINIDYRRYDEEIKLWKYYGHGDNPSLKNIYGKIESHIYLNEIDDTVYPRILPIVLVNKDYSVIKKELIKNVLFTTGNIEILIESILLSKLLYLLINEEDDIVGKLKEEIIKLSQIEFIEDYGDDYRIPVEEFENEFTISFERNRIFALNTLNGIYSSNFKTLEDSLEVFVNEKIGSTNIGRCISGFLDKEYKDEVNLENYYKELISYLYRLRKGRINPESLRIKEYLLPDVFNFEEGEVFYHSLLNKVKVIKKEKANSKTIIYLNTKSGIYKFTS